MQTRSRALAAVSTMLMALGATLLLVSVAYLVYARTAEAQLGVLNQSAVGPVSLQDGAPSPAAGSEVAAEMAPAASLTESVPSAQAPVPFVSRAAFPPATRVQIPRLEIDSRTMELGTVIENGELVWETPKWAVGHHKGTANPGEIGNMVLSGHISSPLRKEGNVFQRLPEIKPGDEVVVASDTGTFYYRVTETKVVEPHQVEVMAPTPEPVVTLITCVPDWVYTHRLIVTAKPSRWEYNTQGIPAED